MKSNSLFVLLLLICSFTLVSCEDAKDKVSETTEMQSEISSKNEIQAENANLKAKAEEMERDLTARHHFFQALKGRYEGTFKIGRGELQREYKIRITLSPSLAPYSFAEYRPHRRLEEIASDLNLLAFHAHIIQWNPQNTLSAVSCRVDSIRPDLKAGEIIISSSSCPNLYAIKVTNDENDTYSSSLNAELLAKRLLDGADDMVELLVGEIQPSSSSEIYSFMAKR